MAKSREGKGAGELTQIGDLITPKLVRQIKRRSGPTPIQQRLIEAAALSVEQPDAQSLLYQHTVFCQTSLPYRNPGDDARTWERQNGDVHLKVLAGEGGLSPNRRNLSNRDVDCHPMPSFVEL
jgi:hypothetical protein